MLGVSRESINKHLAAWQKAGLVRMENGAIIMLDQAAVTRLAEGADPLLVGIAEPVEKSTRSRSPVL